MNFKFKLTDLGFAEIALSAFMLFLTISSRLSALLFAIIFLLWIGEGKWKDRLSHINENKHFLWLPLLYMCYLFAMLYTSNQAIGWNKMQTLLTLLFIPLIFPTLKSLNIHSRLNTYIGFYITGISLNMIFCLIRSTSLFLYELYCRKNNIILDEYPYTNYFFYSYLSYFMHYGYMAMYVNISIAFLFSYLVTLKAQLNRQLLIISLIALQSVYVLMLYSKAGIIALLLIYIAFLFYYLLVSKKVKQSAYILLSLVIIFILLFKVVPHTSERLEGMIKGISETKIDPASDESTQIRLMAWKTSKDLIKNNWLWGYGTGDANEVLQDSYLKNGFNSPYEKKINSHNQFLQSMLSVGLPGTILLLFFFVFLFYRSIKRMSFLLFTFSLITLFAFLTESYLETQVGVFYTSLFSTLLLIKTKHIE